MNSKIFSDFSQVFNGAESFETLNLIFGTFIIELLTWKPWKPGVFCEERFASEACFVIEFFPGLHVKIVEVIVFFFFSGISFFFKAQIFEDDLSLGCISFICDFSTIQS